MTTSTTITEIRATFDLLTAQLANYAQDEVQRISDFAKLVSGKGMDVATEAVVNDLSGETVAQPGEGINIFTRVIERREAELEDIKNAKDEITKIKQKLVNVGGRLVQGN